jgi:DNA-binding CsgD family transcriptional regulator
MIAEGKSDGQIARELGISQPKLALLLRALRAK